mgnify:CR=1 FL=1
MPPLLINILAFIIVIGVLVFIHELGHFLAAIMTGMRADIFSIGMGPRLMGWNRKTGFTFGKLPDDVELGPDTDYRLCWLPIGGYVRILGMIDESFDTEFASKAPQPYEFRSKKNWQKAFVLSAGVIMNVLFAIAVFTVLLLVNGTDVPRSTKVAWVEPGSTAARAGIMAGDSVVSVDGVAMTNWIDTKVALTSSESGLRTVEVYRDGQSQRLQISSDELVKDLADSKDIGMEIAVQVFANQIVVASPTSRADIRLSDTIVSMGSQPINAIGQFRSLVRSHAGTETTIEIKRKDSILTKQVPVSADSTIGIGISGAYRPPIDHKSYNIFEALVEGLKAVGNTFDVIWSTLARVFRGVVAAEKALGGPLTIAMQAGQSMTAGTVPFLGFMALISLSLAFMNLLPLPGLDGGHLLIVAIESIIRRELSTKVKIRIQQVGVFLLLALMAGILFMEIRKIFFR